MIGVSAILRHERAARHAATSAKPPITTEANQLRDASRTATASGLLSFASSRLVDVRGKAVEVHRDPGPDGYRRSEVHGPGASVSSPDPAVADLDVGALFAGLA